MVPILVLIWSVVVVAVVACLAISQLAIWVHNQVCLWLCMLEVLYLHTLGATCQQAGRPSKGFSHQLVIP